MSDLLIRNVRLDGADVAGDIVIRDGDLWSPWGDADMELTRFRGHLILV